MGAHNLLGDDVETGDLANHDRDTLNILLRWVVLVLCLKFRSYLSLDLGWAVQ